MSRKVLSDPDKLNVARIIPVTEAEGPGKRLALWVQGCPMRCEGCCNPEFLPYMDAEWMSIDAIVDAILLSKEENGIEGVTFLGGEPFTQPEALARVAERIRPQGLTVMVFTGFIKERLEKSKKQGTLDLLAQTDLLVDGPFDNTQIDSERRWIGSTNQRTLSLTDFYKDLADDWDKSPETLEFRLRVSEDGEIDLQVNGSPFLLDIKGQFAWAPCGGENRDDSIESERNN